MSKLMTALNAIAANHGATSIFAALACLLTARLKTIATKYGASDIGSALASCLAAAKYTVNTDAPPVTPAECTDTITTQIYSNDCKAPYKERCIGVMDTGILMLNCGAPGTIFTVKFSSGRKKLTRKFIVEDTPGEYVVGLYGAYSIRSLTDDEICAADLQTIVSLITDPGTKLYSVEVTQNGRAIDWDIDELDWSTIFFTKTMYDNGDIRWNADTDDYTIHISSYHKNPTCTRFIVNAKYSPNEWTVDQKDAVASIAKKFNVIPDKGIRYHANCEFAEYGISSDWDIWETFSTQADAFGFATEIFHTFFTFNGYFRITPRGDFFKKLYTPHVYVEPATLQESGDLVAIACFDNTPADPVDDTPPAPPVDDTPPAPPVADTPAEPTLEEMKSRCYKLGRQGDKLRQKIRDMQYLVDGQFYEAYDALFWKYCDETHPKFVKGLVAIEAKRDKQQKRIDEMIARKDCLYAECSSLGATIDIITQHADTSDLDSYYLDYVLYDNWYGIDDFDGMPVYKSPRIEGWADAPDDTPPVTPTPDAEVLPVEVITDSAESTAETELDVAHKNLKRANANLDYVQRHTKAALHRAKSADKKLAKSSAPAVCGQKTPSCIELVKAVKRQVEFAAIDAQTELNIAKLNAKFRFNLHVMLQGRAKDIHPNAKYWRDSKWYTSFSVDMHSMAECVDTLKMWQACETYPLDSWNIHQYGDDGVQYGAAESVNNPFTFHLFGSNENRNLRLTDLNYLVDKFDKAPLDTTSAVNADYTPAEPADTTPATANNNTLSAHAQKVLKALTSGKSDYPVDAPVWENHPSIHTGYKTPFSNDLYGFNTHLYGEYPRLAKVYAQEFNYAEGFLRNVRESITELAVEIADADARGEDLTQFLPKLNDNLKYAAKVTGSINDYCHYRFCDLLIAEYPDGVKYDFRRWQDFQYHDPQILTHQGFIAKIHACTIIARHLITDIEHANYRADSQIDVSKIDALYDFLGDFKSITYKLKEALLINATQISDNVRHIRSASRKYAFVSMNGDKHLVPESIGEYTYRHQHCGLIDENARDYDTLARQYVFAKGEITPDSIWEKLPDDVHAPAVFEIDTADGAELIIDGKITVIHVKAK